MERQAWATIWVTVLKRSPVAGWGARLGHLLESAHALKSAGQGGFCSGELGEPLQETRGTPGRRPLL